MFRTQWILAQATPPQGTIIPAGMGSEGLFGGYGLYRQFGPAVRVETSTDQETWTERVGPWAFHSSTYIRLTRTDTSPVASVLVLDELKGLIENPSSFGGVEANEGRIYVSDVGEYVSINLPTRSSGGMAFVAYIAPGYNKVDVTTAAATGDLDLYVERAEGAEGISWEFLGRSTTDSPNEAVSIENAVPGWYLITVKFYTDEEDRPVTNGYFRIIPSTV